MRRAGKICETENLLYKQLDTGDVKHLEPALDFYHRVNLLGERNWKSVIFQGRK